MAGRILSLALLAACSFPSVASADWIVSPYIGARFAGSTTFFVGREGAEENKLTFGSFIGFLSDGILGVEADLGFVPGFFEGAFVDESLVTTLTGNVIVAAPLGLSQYGLRPYLTGGLGLMRAHGDPDVIDSRLLAMTLGGGAIGPLSPRTSVRFDLRYFRNVTGDPEADTAANEGVELSFWRGTVGLTFRF